MNLGPLEDASLDFQQIFCVRLLLLYQVKRNVKIHSWSYVHENQGIIACLQCVDMNRLRKYKTVQRVCNPRWVQVKMCPCFSHFVRVWSSFQVLVEWPCVLWEPFHSWCIKLTAQSLYQESQLISFCASLHSFWGCASYKYDEIFLGSRWSKHMP